MLKKSVSLLDVPSFDLHNLLLPIPHHPRQGELLDQIEFQVKQAGDYVEEANVDVHQAIEYQKSIRKKQWYVLKVTIELCMSPFGCNSEFVMR